MFMATADYYYPDWECLVDFFCNSGLKNCWHGWPGIEPTTTTLDLIVLSQVPMTSQPQQPQWIQMPLIAHPLHPPYQCEVFIFLPVTRWRTHRKGWWSCCLKYMQRIETSFINIIIVKLSYFGSRLEIDSTILIPKSLQLLAKTFSSKLWFLDESKFMQPPS